MHAPRHSPSSVNLTASTHEDNTTVTNTLAPFYLEAAPLFVDFFNTNLTNILQQAPELLLSWSSKAKPELPSQVYLGWISQLKQCTLNSDAVNQLCVTHLHQFKQSLIAHKSSALEQPADTLTLADADDTEYSVAFDKAVHKLLSPYASQCNTLIYSFRQHYHLSCADNVMPFHPQPLITSLVTWLAATATAAPSTDNLALLTLIIKLVSIEPLLTALSKSFTNIGVRIVLPSFNNASATSVNNTPVRTPHPANTNTIHPSASGTPASGSFAHNGVPAIASPTDIRSTDAQLAVAHERTNTHATSAHNTAPQQQTGSTQPLNTYSGQLHINVHDSAIGVNAQQLLQQSIHLASVNTSIANNPLTALNSNPLLTAIPLSTGELQHKIASIQQTYTANTADTQQITSVDSIRQQLRAALIANDDSEQTLAASDAHTINLVSALFSTIFDDIDLPNSIKVLISRLQLPFFQIALNDISLFESPNHPARHLLNLLAQMGIHCEDGNTQNDVYLQLKSIVKRILTEYTGELEPLNAILHDLQQYAQAFLKQNAKITQKTSKAAEEQDKLNHYKTTVQAVINQHIANTNLPLTVLKLIHTGWRSVLLQTAIRHGTDHNQWRSAVSVLSALTWSVTPQSSPAWYERATKLQPNLITQLQKGLQSISFDKTVQNKLLDSLKDIHQQILTHQPVHTVAVIKHTHTTEQITAEPPEHAGAHQVSINTLSHASNDTITTVVVGAAIPHKPNETTLPLTHPLMQLVHHLPLNTMIEIVIKSVKQHTKLVARMHSNDTLILSNMRGIKIQEISENALANQLDSGSARIVDQSLALFDKALLKLVNSINTAAQAV